VNKNYLQDEIEQITKESKLFEISNLEAFCAPAAKIPNLLTEIGRKREITFRKVGEGTNKSIDLDEYDKYFDHLFLWDRQEREIIGSYRIGLGKKILASLGKKGFYISSLFRIKNELITTLEQSIELGRSFIVPEYQQKGLPLFLLWKGILYFLIKNRNYRYLIGPVSISNEYSDFSRQLIVEFFRSFHLESRLSKLVRPKHKFNPKLKELDLSVILGLINNNIAELDRYVKETDPLNKPIPVLFKKYIKHNAKVIRFNLDPEFNNCLDGLMILDLHEFPTDVIKTLSEEIEDKELLSFFNRRKELIEQ
ncbi:MAG: GNAT family N-acetyltransferase, partial [Bacteroidales bacterium]